MHNQIVFAPNHGPLSAPFTWFSCILLCASVAGGERRPRTTRTIISIRRKLWYSCTFGLYCCCNGCIRRIAMGTMQHRRVTIICVCVTGRPLVCACVCKCVLHIKPRFPRIDIQYTQCARRDSAWSRHTCYVVANMYPPGAHCMLALLALLPDNK